MSDPVLLYLYLLIVLTTGNCKLKSPYHTSSSMFPWIDFGDLLNHFIKSDRAFIRRIRVVKRIGAGLELMEISVVVFLLQGYQFTRQEVRS